MTNDRLFLEDVPAAEGAWSPTQPSAIPPEGRRRLDQGAFSFHGFGGLRGQVERRIRRAEIRSGEPGVMVVEGAVFGPADQTGRSRRSRGARAVGSLGPAAEAPGREVDEEVVYLGWLFNHYGHFLTESLARIWFLAEVDPSVRVVFHHPNPPWAPSGWVLRILEAFGVPRDRILLPEVPTRVRRAIVPEPLFEPRSVAGDRTVRAHVRWVRPYREVAARTAGDIKPSAQPGYLSRRLLPSSQRPIVGEDGLEELLRENGFLVAHPEAMAFEDQVRLVNAHADIFSSTGSAAHNVLFALGRPRLHLLANRDRFSPNYALCSELVGVPTTFVNCLSTGGRPALDGAAKETPHLVELPTLVEYLEARGFLTKPPPAALNSRSPSLQTQYDEAWLYGRVRTATERREALPAEVEDEAMGLAAASWPVSLVLARYYARRDVARADGLAQQFAELAAAESDGDRLAHYRAEVEEMTGTLARKCGPETAGRLGDVVRGRFRGDLKGRGMGR